MSVEAQLQASVAYAPLQRMRHSAAHVMAEAVQELFPDARFAIGPAIEDGFYYDFELPRSLTPEDLPNIEQRMARIIAEKQPFVQDRWSREKALAYFRAKDQPYKVEIIENLPDAEVGIYQQGDFLDLCRGPHVEHTGQIGAFKLTHVAGAYWRGDEQRPMLQRLYGTAWFTQEELEQHLQHLEEAQRRDHRRLGRELKLFMFSPEVGPGLPLWLPRGVLLRQELEGFLVEEQRKRGYVHVMTPQIGQLDLYKTSGHWYKYRDEIYPPMAVTPGFDPDAEEPQGEVYILRPMNCPHHIQIYKNELRSYRELPLRLAEMGMAYRYEKPGEIHGLLRARGFTIDDSHIFAMPDQLHDEFLRVVDLMLVTFKTLGIEQFRARVGTRAPDSAKYIGNEEVWTQAQADIVSALQELEFPYTVEEGEAGFYGPKLDFLFRDALKREWQLGTVQVDYNLPERFDLWYVGSDGQRHRPVMIHRAPGSIERLVAIVIEHFAGAFPVWLAPVQAMVIPIADRHIGYASKVAEILTTAGVRAEINAQGGRMNAKIRDAQLQKIPYMLVVGDKEAADEAVSVRLRSHENLSALPLADLLARVKGHIDSKSKDL